jgi:hypothetical protein
MHDLEIAVDLWALACRDRIDRNLSRAAAMVEMPVSDQDQVSIVQFALHRLRELRIALPRVDIDDALRTVSILERESEAGMAKILDLHFNQ